MDREAQRVMRTDRRSALSSYIRARLLREEREYGHGFRSEVARRSGLSTAHISNLINREDQKIGIDAAEALAGFWKMSFAQLSDEAEQWVKDNPVPDAPHFPNLEAAVDFMRSRGLLADELVDVARRVAQQGRDFSVPVWIAVLHDLVEASAEKVPAKLPATTKRSKRTGS